MSKIVLFVFYLGLIVKMKFETMKSIKKLFIEYINKKIILKRPIWIELKYVDNIYKSIIELITFNSK